MSKKIIKSVFSISLALAFFPHISIAQSTPGVNPVSPQANGFFQGAVAPNGAPLTVQQLNQQVQQQNATEQNLNAQWPTQGQAGQPAAPQGSAVPVAGMPGGLMAPVLAPSPVPAQEPARATRPPLEHNRASSFTREDNARQRGERVGRALHQGVAQSQDEGDQMFVRRWMHQLLNAGVPLSKIHFEASRLNREEFAMWASRQLWTEQAQHPAGLHVHRQPTYD